MLYRLPLRVSLLITCALVVTGQEPRASQLLAQALHFADLYNWADAAPEFAQAEQLFVASGDKRNALYARLGLIRSNIERDQQTLPMVAAQLGEMAEDDPLVQNDKELRLLCFIVKGDIDTEINTSAMRKDWEQVESLSRELGDAKWGYRALAQIGVASFYDADLENARKDIGAALEAAKAANDRGAEIRFLTILANGLVESKMYDQALVYLENANKLADGTPDAGYQFTAQELRVDALIGVKQLDAAQGVADDILMHARSGQRAAHEATALGLSAEVADARKDPNGALATLVQAASIAESAGLKRLLAGVYGKASEIYRQHVDLEKAEHFAELSAEATQDSGNLWAVPRGLQIIAELQIARGKYSEADLTYDRAEAFVDSMIGKVSTALEKTAIITASSQIYSQHFSLIAEHFNDPGRGYSIVEQVRGRATADLLAAGSASSPNAWKTERTIAQLRLKLMSAHATDQVRLLRDQIFMTEQARWVSPEVSVLKAQAREPVEIAQIAQTLPPSTVLLEYVVTDPSSYCLVISRGGSRIVRLESKGRLEVLVAAFLKAVKAKLPAVAEGRHLYDALLGPIREAGYAKTLVIVRDGELHLVPFDGLRDPSGHYVVDTRTVVYSPSATSYRLLTEQGRHSRTASNTLLAMGGIPYSISPINKSGLTRGYDRGGFADLPSSEDEVEVARAAFPKGQSKLLIGTSATEAAFKSADLAQYRVIHLAVHGFADSTFPDRAALVLLSDKPAGEDGFLQASEIVQLHLRADLVVLSACDTAVGPLQGQEGIANLSKAFLLAGAGSVLSTLWQIDDSSSLYLMKRFYAHLSETQSAAAALTAAKRDMLRTFGRNALPYQWAGFTIEGSDERPNSSTRSNN